MIHQRQVRPRGAELKKSTPMQAIEPGVVRWKDGAIEAEREQERRNCPAGAVHRFLGSVGAGASVVGGGPSAVVESRGVGSLGRSRAARSQPARLAPAS